MTLTPKVLEGSDKWRWYGDPIPGGLWATDSGVHLAWIAYRSDPEANGAQVLTLILSSLTIGDEHLTEHARYDLYPPGIYTGDSGQVVFAGRPNGTYAIGYHWWRDDERVRRAALGRVGESAFYATADVPEGPGASPIVAHTAAAWDGEAFALHAWGSEPRVTLHVARVDDQGSVLLPFTEYGLTANAAPGLGGHATSTSAESGRTYVFDAAGEKLLSGHLRDGARLPGTEAGPMVLVHPDDNGMNARLGRVSAEGDGAWLSWWQFTLTPSDSPVEIWVVRFDSVAGALGKAAVVPVQPFGTAGGGISSWALLSRGESVVVFGASDSDIYRFDYDGTTLGSPERTLVDGKYLDIREMEAVEHEGTQWLMYAQSSAPSYLRVLKVAPGCVYPGSPEGL
jgi:hypothetical protein